MSPIRDEATGMFVGKDGPRPDPDALRTEIAELVARRTALEAQVRDRFLDCALANSFHPIAPLTEEIRGIAERIADLQAQLPEIEQAERDRLAEVRRKEQVARSRAVFAHCNRAKAGARDVGLAINGFRVAYEKMVDGFDGIGAVLTVESGYELADDWREAIDSRVMADVITAMRGAPSTSLSELAEPTIEAARSAAGEMQRSVAAEPEATDPPDTEPEPEQQE